MFGAISRLSIGTRILAITAFVVVLCNVAQVVATRHQIDLTSLAILCGTLAVSLGLLLTVLLPLNRAIAQLTAAATQVARGDTNFTLTVKRGDALGEMALAFQDMANHLVDAERRTKESAAALAQSVTTLIDELAPAAEGDLTARPTISAEAGDIAVVADFTGVLITSFSDVTKRVRSASRQAQTSSEQLSAHVQQLNQAVRERAAQVTETAAIADKIADAAGEVLRAVEQVNRASQDAAHSVEQGDAAVAQTLERMDAMRTNMIQATRQIKRLSDSSLAMNDTVGLVLQFAGDLELLADNAQIEAARHTAAGGVFTAVAEQTGRLAEDAQKALTDIQAAVLNNRQETAEVGRQMEQVATDVLASARAVEAARAAFANITHAMGELGSFVDRVHEVTKTQVLVAEAVSTAMEQITAFFSQTAAGVHVSEAEATQLHETIDGLRDSIANLKVDDDEHLTNRAVA
jgi:methyl-accepting chemotaxis protein